jgi:hypothetical protein
MAFLRNLNPRGVNYSDMAATLSDVFDAQKHALDHVKAVINGCYANIRLDNNELNIYESTWLTDISIVDSLPSFNIYSDATITMAHLDLYDSPAVAAFIGQVKQLQHVHEVIPVADVLSLMIRGRRCILIDYNCRDLRIERIIIDIQIVARPYPANGTDTVEFIRQQYSILFPGEFLQFN